jgi:hydroxyacyl-ACP dehydratase HTD2-like protein with hotdog domain
MIDIEKISAGYKIPEERHTATNVSLFLYNAVVWNAHRIHYDEPYTTNVEKHPAIVIDGPLQGDWLSQVVVNWLDGQGELLEFEYSNRRASYLGETLTAGGEVISFQGNKIALDLAIMNGDGEITTPGSAVISIG